MPSPLPISRALLLLGIYISNIGSIAILWQVLLGFIKEPFVILSAVLSIFALFVFPVIASFGRLSEVCHTRYLIAFGALCLLDLPSCITLPFRAVQNNATALCQDLSASGNCTSAYVLIGFYYASTIFAIIGFVITYIDRRAGGTPKVSPWYPNSRATNSPFTTFQYPQGVELENVKVFTGLPTRNARQAHAEWSTKSPA